ncbi:nucleotidyltransferase family protein [bacterium]|nr:nucleotidyltransferase family protein [bacterium]
MDLLTIAQGNKYIKEALIVTGKYEKQRLYISAGALAQTVWNSLFQRTPEYGIEDLDIIYYDNKNLTAENEQEVYEEIKVLLPNIPIKLDIKNQARVHCWYEKKFGYVITQPQSLEEAIGRFPTTATAIGVHTMIGINCHIIAPLGTQDLFSGVVRANKRQITQEIYETKIAKWKRKWPELKILDW